LKKLGGSPTAGKSPNPPPMLELLELCAPFVVLSLYELGAVVATLFLTVSGEDNAPCTMVQFAPDQITIIRESQRLA